MNDLSKNLGIVILLLQIWSCGGQRDRPVSGEGNTDSSALLYHELHRPQLHFTPKSHWMNDPNGMVYHNGEYHLFYQHYPGGNKWGPMHWGHAVSKDLVRWEHLPIALYPDSLGYIFSGSAVVDQNNTSGFGSVQNPPLVAVYTYHSAEKEKAGEEDYQYQGIAFSIDNGRSWTKYEGNPVLPNQGIRDFRDPKVFWHQPTSNWIMILAVKDHTELWASPDLKRWSKLSDFGQSYGAHGGVWECPDLFPIKPEAGGKEKWIMIVSINPGGPNGGSATQYFIGDFDGRTFHPDEAKQTVKWIDYGPDNYAGITWSNAPDNRNIFLGWMSNWAYAEKVPTTVWRSAMTLPRDLSLRQVNNGWYVTSSFSPEVNNLGDEQIVRGDLEFKDTVALSIGDVRDVSLSKVSGTFEAKDFSLMLSNAVGQTLSVGFDREKNLFYVDRGKSGKNDFSEAFNSYLTAKRISNSDQIKVEMVIDVSSVEILFDDGLTAMTAVYFPDERMNKITIHSAETNRATDVRVREMKSIW
jgi:fructan beta-fructosidase